ncbi:radical SAM protein [Candidatus Nitrosocosmicus franklandus]|uniref:Oxygen-independent coproporphyrinogen-III oxidase 1 n=1 Tax=Candidatus Nitrosocosmicus franklandianus TaxID=1798806 RepID=A0A484IJH5_9ARCH|nr:radical SAM protein [Candidatus Nitrosocosmicus franklandus]VFJ15039.1 Oxygen-independent coproporphyrinogen-III oxidase 1 [Candidatus Nitrosocosmicus franklandus]
MELVYDYPLYRPPSESHSLIFQVTLGCSFNKCSFCNMYRSKEYVERPIEEIFKEIELMAKYYPLTRRIFLADGDAMNLDSEKLIEIITKIREDFRNVDRISCYSMPKNLLQKSADELRGLKNAGLDMVYLGIESGNDQILKKVTKGATSETIVKSCKKAKDAGFILSCMVILGLGGRTYTTDHVKDTAEVISIISPDYVGALTLYMEPNIEKEFYEKFGEPFLPLEDNEVLVELYNLIGNINAKNKIIFRANHASNVYSIGGTLPDDKEEMLQKLDKLRDHPELFRSKVLRRF